LKETRERSPSQHDRYRISSYYNYVIIIKYNLGQGYG
jgi:hypothetical protein